MPSVFDPTALLLNAETEQQFTKAPPLPIGEYQAITGTDFKVKEVDGKNGVFYTVEFPVYIDGNVVATLPDGSQKTVHEIVGKDRIQLRADGYADFNGNDPTKGWNFDAGMNSFMRKVREALGQDDPKNLPGGKWKLAMVGGQPCKVLVGQRPNKNDPTEIFNEIVSFIKPQ